MARILLVDDDTNLREVLTFALREEKHEVQATADGAAALERLERFSPELVITDLKMPKVGGMDVLRAVHRWDAGVPVIVLTAYGTIEDAVEAMKEGAYHYLTKPYNRDELRLMVNQALERRRLALDNRALRERLRETTRRSGIVYASRAMEHVLELVERVAPTDATVLVTGESGTGKELVARALHDGSERWERPFVAVNCGAIPRDLMESELFGHARGAFTGAVKDKAGKFQRADGGTLFLDEVGELGGDLQTKLLRVLETGQVDVVGGTRLLQVDVRIIAATNADLAARVREGTFRTDLFHRLNVIPIMIPPLRERREDIPALWEHFTRRFAGEAAVRTAPELMRRLMARDWPGNVRELANLCQRMVLLRSGEELTEDDLPGEQHGAEGDRERAGGAGVGYATGDFLGELPEERLPLREVEREIIVRALARHGGNRSRTAAYLGIPRHVLLYRLEKYGIGKGERDP